MICADFLAGAHLDAGIRRRSCPRWRAFSSFFLANSDMHLRKRWPRQLQML